ncbi:hypothetical protein NE237_032189 [Protea cynaroides]|uniref:Uncharacterized protein n=1 Tax=Protea cynaroides TaxID=273540 RepID=A0A9Q0L2M0_9MAGN|nr:hypothetical protein NE237_032189 [Protea cynaroides]
MALTVGSSKGCGHSSKRGRAYGMLLLLAFGAAVFGVMILHKLRERRVCDLLLKDKDRESFSLQFLLQKEKVNTKEVKRKIEEMRTKIDSLGIQKMELHDRILEMQSMTASLKQEHRALEAALENKQNENQILREKEISSTKENPEIISLRELLKQKEAEIEEIKHHHEKPVNIWSVSADDPSNPPANLTTTETMFGDDKNEVGMKKEERLTAEDLQLQESLNVKDDQNSTSTQEDGGGSGGENPTDRGASMQDSTHINADEHQGEGQIEGDGELKRPEDSQEDKGLIERNQSRGNQVKMDESSNDGELLKTGDAEITDGKDHGAIKDGELGEMNPQDNNNQALSAISNGEMKLEVQPDTSKFGRKMRHRRRRTRSRKRELKKSGNSEEVKSQGAHKTRFSLRDEHDQEIAVVRDEQVDGHSEGHEKAENEGLDMNTDTNNQVAIEGREISLSSGVEDKPGVGEKQGLEVSSESDLLKPQNPPDAEDLGSANTDNQVGKEQETPQDEKLGNPQESEDGEGLNRVADGAIELNLVVGQQPEDQEATGVKKLVEMDATDNIMDIEKAKDDNGNNEAENLEVHHIGEQAGELQTEDVPAILDPELKKDIEENGNEDNTEVEF